MKKVTFFWNLASVTQGVLLTKKVKKFGFKYYPEPIIPWVGTSVNREMTARGKIPYLRLAIFNRAKAKDSRFKYPVSFTLWVAKTVCVINVKWQKQGISFSKSFLSPISWRYFTTLVENSNLIYHFGKDGIAIWL